MKVLRILGLIFTKIALVISVLLFMLSLCTSFVLENGISSLLIGGLPNFGESLQRKELTVENVEQLEEIDLNEVYNQVLNEIGISEEQLLNILESPVAKELVSEFVDTVLEDVTSGDTSDFNLGEKVLDFVTDNQSEIESVIGEPLPMDKIENFANSDEVSNFNEQYKNVMSTVSGKIPTPLKGVIEFVEKFISEDFREGCLIIGLISIILTALLQWSLYKWIRTLGNTALGIGIFTFIISLIGNIFSSAIAALLRFGGTLGFGKAVWSSAICGGTGIILLIVYAIIKKCADKKENKNEISQNA